MAYRILLVDDEHQLRRMVGEILEQEGYAVLLAADCAQGEELFCREQPDAVLLDVMLPDGNGFSLFQKLRAVRDVPVLFLSARDEMRPGCAAWASAPTTISQNPFCRRSCCCGWRRCCAGSMEAGRKMQGMKMPCAWAAGWSTGAQGWCCTRGRAFP